MEDSKKMDAERTYLNGNKEIDDDVSVIAVIGKENDRSSELRPDENVNCKQNRRVFELSDERSKIALRKQLDLEALSTEQVNATKDYQGIEILQKLPPGTIVIKKERKYKDDSDYTRDSTETSSGGSTSGGGTTKVRRVHRATRKNRGTTEVRRNPIRVTKKDLDKDFPRPRQRLLSAKRKEMLLDSELTKRGKSSTMPYMNTRSVTRKMYNVGATYQAPTIRDETEWKEWPVHGMHERPVFHPQVGLAAEYLGRYFASLDGLSYREIIDRPEIEVVSVDPHCDFLPSSTEKKRSKKIRPNRGSSFFKNSKATSGRSPEQAESFENCMHESFHCVLGYCSQVMAPTYKTNVEGKINMLSSNRTSSKSVQEAEKQPFMANVVEQSSKSGPTLNFKENLQRPVEESKLTENVMTTVFPQTVKNINQVSKTRLFPAHKVYVANSQKSIAFTNLKTFQGGQMKIQDLVRSSKSPFILVNPSEVKDAQLSKPMASDVNLIKLEESTRTEETLGELSSIYKNVSNDESTMKQLAAKRGSKVEFTVTKYLLDNVQQKNIQVPKELNAGEKKAYYETSGKELNMNAACGSSNKTWCTSEASEIAKILSEYNKSNSKKPAVESQTLCANAKSIRAKELCNKEENVKQAQESSTERNMNITFPQGKWRRFHLTVEKLKNLKSNSTEKRSCSGLQNRQQLFRVDQSPADVSSERKAEIPKQLESLQRGQASLTALEKKDNTSAAKNALDTNTVNTRSLQELLENTAMLYCAATGTHQDDLANYIDSLDAAQSIQWLESCNNLIV